MLHFFASYRLFLLLSTVSAVCLFTQSSFAQSSSDAGFLRPLDGAFSAEGFVYKGFSYSPFLAVTTSLDDNVFAVGQNEQDDIIVTTRAGLGLEKEYGGLVLQLDADAEFQRYDELSTEDKDNYSLVFSADYDANSRWQFPFSASYTNRFRDRGDPIGTAVTSSVPLRTKITQFSGGAVRTFNRLSLGLIGQYTLADFEDGTSNQDASVPVVFSDNDRQEFEGRLELSYSFLRGEQSVERAEHFAFANLAVGVQDFERRAFTGSEFNGVNRNRNVFSGILGFQTNYKGILFARLGAGYLIQKFEDDTLDATESFDFEADIGYLVTPKLVLGFSAERDIEQDNNLSQGTIQTDLSISADYELQHNLFLIGELGYEENSFETGNREDEDFTSELRLQYNLNRNIEARLGLRHIRRDSSSDASDYDRTVFLLGLTGRL